MNNGNYPDPVINEAMKLMRKGVEPKDVIDVFLLKYDYRDLHPRTVKRWYEKWPLGKSPKSLPSKFIEEVAEVVREQTSKSPIPDGFREEVRELRGPLQERAHAMHLKGEHSYLEDDQYEGHVFITETIDGPNFWEGWEVPPGSRYSVKPDNVEANAIRVPLQRQIRKCLWCSVFIWTEPGATPETPSELTESIYDRRTIKWTQTEDPA